MIKGLYEAHLPVSNIEKSIEFYQNIGLELAYKGKKVTFFWIEKGRSWLGLWECEEAQLPYHPSIRHLAFYVENEDIKKAKTWLEKREINVKEKFGFSQEQQPLVLANNPHTHAAIYFQDPDDNSLEFISPLMLDNEEAFEMMELKDWFNNHI
ncbi:VOC family protein [Halobacillus litoralis]|uniref:Glutathione transferase n=1 Tax=Halobacillus litoralis TaxID=45668 RepID=A0A410MJ48_9BACI|nr:VOC family protein [Halobacillus litoralis]QAS54731.1 glutathione transferase [Halobacillus litoralis]